MLDKVVKALPLISIALVLLGIYNMSRFYSWYDIQIFNYVDAAEIFLFFTNLVVVLLILASIIIFSAAIARLFPQKQSKTQVLRDQKNDESDVDYKLYKRKQLKRSKLKALLAICTILLLEAILIYISRNSTETDLFLELIWLVAVGINIVLVPVPFIHWYVARNNVIKSSWRGAEWKILLASLPFLLIYFEARNYRYFQQNMLNPRFRVKIHFNNGDSLITTNNFIYISSSRNYIFFRNKLDSTTTIIPKGDCRRIQIRELRPLNRKTSTILELP